MLKDLFLLCVCEASQMSTSAPHRWASVQHARFPDCSAAAPKVKPQSSSSVSGDLSIAHPASCNYSFQWHNQGFTPISIAMLVEQHCWVSFAWMQQSGGSSTKSLVVAVMQEAEKSKLRSGSVQCWADNSRGWNRSKIIEREQKGWLCFNPILQVLFLPVLTCKIPTAPLRSRNRSEYSSFVCLIYRKHFMPD